MKPKPTNYLLSIYVILNPKSFERKKYIFYKNTHITPKSSIQFPTFIRSNYTLCPCTKWYFSNYTRGWQCSRPFNNPRRLNFDIVCKLMFTLYLYFLLDKITRPANRQITIKDDDTFNIQIHIISDQVVV